VWIRPSRWRLGRLLKIAFSHILFEGHISFWNEVSQFQDRSNGIKRWKADCNLLNEALR
jgi:hypothetical protein